MAWAWLGKERGRPQALAGFERPRHQTEQGSVPFPLNSFKTSSPSSELLWICGAARSVENITSLSFTPTRCAGPSEAMAFGSLSASRRFSARLCAGRGGRARKGYCPSISFREVPCGARNSRNSSKGRWVPALPKWPASRWAASIHELHESTARSPRRRRRQAADPRRSDCRSAKPIRKPGLFARDKSLCTPQLLVEVLPRGQTGTSRFHSRRSAPAAALAQSWPRTLSTFPSVVHSDLGAAAVNR